MIKRALYTPHPLMRAAYVLVGVGFLLVGLLILSIAFTPTPDLNSFADRKVSQSTKIYDRTGETILYDLNRDVRRNLVPLSEISPYIQKAAISIEDADFYYHNGISIPAIIRAVLSDIEILVGLSSGYTQGGSTITQQVVKMTLLTNEKSITRKVREWVLALKLESKYSKDQILELYLNNSPYGGSFYGVETASRAFFGKSAKDVTLAEAAYLAALPQAPTYYSPYGNNREALDRRKNLVLERMKVLGYLDEETAEAAKKEEVIWSPQQSSSIIAPHFVFYVEQYLEEKFGPTVVDQGLSVITTLDLELQRETEAVVARHALENEARFNAENAAAVAIDPKTGQILAMVGSRNYFDPQIDGNYNVAIAKRQPGSSFKPFVYAAALSRGYTPQTVLFDLPTQFSTACAPTDNYNNVSPCYAPKNYDDKFRGPMTFTTAIAQSINIPAVKAAYLAGLGNIITLATRMGITTLENADQYGLSLALGAGEVRLLDMVSAYSAFANDGVRNPPVAILSITDSSGNVVEEFESNATRVIDAGVARDLSGMLSDNEARQPEYPPQNPFYFPGYDVAAKTGTTNDNKDFWTIGYTPSLAVGVWAGNNDPSEPIARQLAGYVVAPMWRTIMLKGLELYPREFFGEGREIPDNAPDMLRGDWRVGRGNDAETHTILHYVDRANPLSGTPAIPALDPQYSAWEYPVQVWLNAGGSTYTGQ